MTSSEILRKHEDANEYHFHDVDRKWIIEAMEEYAKEKSEIPFILELSDEEIEMAAPYVPRDAHDYYVGDRDGFIEGAKWYREQLKTNS